MKASSVALILSYRATTSDMDGGAYHWGVLHAILLLHESRAGRTPVSTPLANPHSPARSEMPRMGDFALICYRLNKDYRLGRQPFELQPSDVVRRKAHAMRMPPPRIAP